VTRVSTRYALPLLALLAVAFAASAAQVVFPRQIDTCRSPESMRATDLIPGSVPEGEQLERRGEAVIQWSEGRLAAAPASGAPFRFQIVRSFGSHLLYLDPLELVDRKLEVHDAEWHEVGTSAGPVEVRVESARARGRVAFVAYFYADGNDPVRHPFLSKLRHAFFEMLTGPRPLSLFAVTGYAAQLADARQQATVWLGAAFEHFAASCRAPAARTARGVD
jgi:hypothetical protein